MKKYLFIVATALAITSCETTLKTARTESVPYAMYNATVADLEVSPNRVTVTTTPSKEVQKGGLSNVKADCIQKALGTDYDLLVEPQFVIQIKKTFCGKKIKSITVSGRPAKYKNFRSLPDGVWTNEVFREKNKQK